MYVILKVQQKMFLLVKWFHLAFDFWLNSLVAMNMILKGMGTTGGLVNCTHIL
jgi:hypothetical protein